MIQIGAEEMSGFLLAVGEDVRQLVEGSDSLELRESLLLQGALDGLAKAVKDAQSLVKTNVLALLVEPVVVDGHRYERKTDGKWKPDGALIRQRVAEAARQEATHIDEETGEVIRDLEEGVRVAVNLMAALYMSPSGMPKAGGLDKLGAFKRDVAKWSATGWRLAVDEAEAEPDDG